jgi:hypothetical protein
MEATYGATGLLFSWLGLLLISSPMNWTSLLKRALKSPKVSRKFVDSMAHDQVGLWDKAGCSPGDAEKERVKMADEKAAGEMIFGLLPNGNQKDFIPENSPS